MIIREQIRKVMEEWNPFSLDDSVYGIESNEINKCIKGTNSSNPEEIAFYVQKVLKGYAAEWNKEFSLDYDEC